MSVLFIVLRSLLSYKNKEQAFFLRILFYRMLSKWHILKIGIEVVFRLYENV